MERGSEEKAGRTERMRKGESGRELDKDPILVTYIECLAVFSLVLQLEVAVHSHYGDTA